MSRTAKYRLSITFNAPVVLLFVLLCFLATLAGELTDGYATEKFFMAYHSSLLDPLTYLRLFTHVLGHSGWSHFIGNASYLLLLGPMLEEKYGGRNLAITIAVTALVIGLVHYIFFWNVAICGASGVVFAFILLASFTSFRDGEIPITFLLVAAIYLGQQIYNGLFTSDNISQLAHILGGIVGAVVGFACNRRGK